MLFLQFSDITHNHIATKWKVCSVLLSPRAVAFPFEGITEISFLPDNNCILSGNKTVTGKWRLEYHKEIIPNPVIYFSLTNQPQEERSMITRYSYTPDKYGEDKNDEMILYFSNGCELVLEKLDDQKNQ
ncbi:MAG: hypothetical protein EOP53_19290 [Sphingobacteriales bacterium]|nr:MAG: hypothetical protein EOP53_19290 [Sphingobacteriales bacterium]